MEFRKFGRSNLSAEFGGIIYEVTLGTTPKKIYAAAATAAGAGIGFYFGRPVAFGTGGFVFSIGTILLYEISRYAYEFLWPK